MFSKLANSYKYRFKKWENAAPGPTRFKTWLDLDASANHHTRFPLELMQQFGDIIRLPTLDMNHIVMNPHAIMHILKHNKKNYIKTKSTYTGPYTAFGESILTLDNEKWEVDRKNIQCAFSKNMLEHYYHNMECLIEKHLNQWKKRNGQKPFNITKNIAYLALDNAYTCQLGHSLDNYKPVYNAAQAITKYVSEKHYPFLPSITKLKFYQKQLIIDRTLKETINNHQIDNNNLLLNILLKTCGSEKQHKDHLFRNLKTMVIAGYETTACLLNWCLYFLSQLPEMQNMLVDETKQCDSFRKLQQCDLLNAFVNEILRLYPPIWNTARLAVNDDYLLDYFIPAKSKLFISIYGLHRNPNYWDEPNIFKPERFLKANKQNLNRDAFMPFGISSHQCIASQFALLETKLVLTKILQSYSLTNATRGKVGSCPYITLQPDRPIQIKLKDRHNSFANGLTINISGNRICKFSRSSA